MSWKQKWQKLLPTRNPLSSAYCGVFENFSVGMKNSCLKALRKWAVRMLFLTNAYASSRPSRTWVNPGQHPFCYCPGGGLELLRLSFSPCGLEGAQIGLPELDLGAVPAWGGSARLAKCVGEQHALDMILRAKKISGPRALEIGLVHEVWPLSELKDKALQLAEELAAMPATAVRAMMSVLVNSDGKNLEQLLAAEREAVRATRGTADAKEGCPHFWKSASRSLIKAPLESCG